jgi:hypothetical protein
MAGLARRDVKADAGDPKYRRPMIARLVVQLLMVAPYEVRNAAGELKEKLLYIPAVWA